MENLTITKEKVLEAASKCSTANATLRVLFPEAFEPDAIDLTPFKGRSIGDSNDGSILWVGDMVAKEQGLKGACFGLSNIYKWKLGKSDSGEYQILIPVRKCTNSKIKL